MLLGRQARLEPSITPTLRGCSRRGERYGFTVLSNRDGHVLGSTRYLDVNEMHRGAEIGWLLFSGPRRVLFNPECRLLLFEARVRLLRRYFNPTQG